MRKSAPAAKGSPARPVAQQRRSLHTEDKLLGAAARVLERDGLDGATVPRIAAEAKLSPGSIYRRFADKDDLLRATFLRTLDTALAHNAESQRSTGTRGTLAETAEALTATLLKGYREHPQLLQALNRLMRANPESALAGEAKERLCASLVHAAEMLLAHRDSIRHPDPERAARFAVLSTMSAIEWAAGDGNSLWHATLPLSDKTFSAELSRQMLAYLRRKP